MVRIVNSIWLASLVSFSFLEATVNVTSSADSGAGTLRQAIEDINNTLTTLATPPIRLNAGINPSLSSNMTPSTLSASIEATDVGTPHTISGNGNVALNVSGNTVVVSASSDIVFSNAPMVVTDGTLQFFGASNLPGVTGVQFGGTAPTLQFSGTASGSFPAILGLLATTKNILKIDTSLTITATGAIAGGLLEKQGSGTLVLPTSNVYGGGTTIVAGAIQVGNNTSLGAGPLLMESDATLILGDGLTVSNLITLQGLPETIEVPVGTSTLTGLIGGLGSLIVTGPGTLILTGANTYIGTTSITSGTLLLSGATATIQHSVGTIVSAGATLDISETSAGASIQTLSGAGFISLGTRTLTVDQVLSGVFVGTIGASGDLGGLTLSLSSTGTLNLGGANLYEGATSILGGTLALIGASGSIASSRSVSVLGTFDISGTSVGAVIHNLSGTGDINLGGKELTVIEAISGSFSGVISGSLGSLVLDATTTETLTLAGINTYTGPTDINGGVLALSGSGSIATSSSLLVDTIFDIHQINSATSIQNLSGSGLIILGSKALTVKQTIPSTFSGNIQGVTGSFGLTNLSTSTLTLTGINTYTGATPILGGTLALVGDGSIALTSSIIVNGTFDISAVTTGAFVGSLSGTGSIILGSKELTLLQRDSGLFTGVISGVLGSLVLDVNSISTLSFSGINTYTGPTSIRGGVLALVGDGSIATSSSVQIEGVLDISDVFSGASIQNLSGVGYIVLGNKTLTVDQNISDIFFGMILGRGGSLTKTGAGTLFLEGSNSYGGLTTILAGTLEGNASSLPTDIVNDSSLVFNQEGLGVYSHSISGTGSLEKTGSGVLVLSGVSTYTGATTVTEGALVINGSIITSSFTVDAGAILGGSGSIGPLDVFGSVRPGNSSGVLEVEGDVLFEMGSAYIVSIDGNGISDLVATGDIILDSDVSLQLNFQPGFLSSINGSATIMQDSATITGSFSSVTTNTSWIVPQVTYAPNAVYLSMVLKPFNILPLCGNSERVANAIDAVIGNGNPALNGIAESLFSLSDEEINEALNKMHPALFKGYVISQENNIVKVQSTLGFRMQNELDDVYCPSSCSKGKQPFHLWVDSFGDNLQQKESRYAHSPQAGYQNNTLGAVLGFDAQFLKRCYAGALGGYTNSRIHWSDDLGKGEIRSGYGGLYFSYLTNMFYVNSSVIGSWGHCDGYRNIRYTGVSRSASSTRGNAQLLSHIDSGVNLGFSHFTIRPFDSLDYITQKENGYREEGAGPYNLKVKESTAILLRNELGLQLTGCISFWSSKWSLAPKFSWVREMRVKGGAYSSEFVDTNTSFTVTGYFPSRNLFSPGVLLSGRLCKDLLVADLYYTGEFGGGYSDHNYGGQLRFGF